MDPSKQFIQNEAQRGTNAVAQAQPNPTPLGPPPMVLQNPYYHSKEWFQMHPFPHLLLWHPPRLNPWRMESITL